MSKRTLGSRFGIDTRIMSYSRSRAQASYDPARAPDNRMAKRDLPKTYEPNPALRALYRRFFEKIQVDEAWVREVRKLASDGPVVYVLGASTSSTSSRSTT